MRTLAIIIALLFSGFTSMASAEKLSLVTTFPESLDSECRDGRAKTYDQCTDQFELYTEAF